MPRLFLQQASAEDFENSTGLTGSRCFEWSDLLSLWHQAAEASKIPVRLRTTSVSEGHGALPSIAPCIEPTDIEDHLQAFNFGVLFILNRADAAVAGGHPNGAAYIAEGAAWCFAQVLRIRPLAIGNYFVAQAAAWMLLGLCHMPVPIGLYPSVVAGSTESALREALDLATEFSLYCEGTDVYPGAELPGDGGFRQDQPLAGWIAAHIVRWKNAHRL